MSASTPMPNDNDRFAAKQAWHLRQSKLPIEEKVRILLELQAQDLELIKRHRPLKWYETPWPQGCSELKPCQFIRESVLDTSIS